MRRLIGRHLFMCIGVVTLALFFIVGALNRSVEYHTAQTLPYHSGVTQEVGELSSPSVRETLAEVVRVLIVPMYLVWAVIAIVQVAVAGPHGLSQPIATVVAVLGMVAGLAPYALMDYIFDRVRRARSRR